MDRNKKAADGEEKLRSGLPPALYEVRLGSLFGRNAAIGIAQVIANSAFLDVDIYRGTRGTLVKDMPKHYRRIVPRNVAGRAKGRRGKP